MGASGDDDVLLVGRSSQIPMVRKIAKEVFGLEPQMSPKPDENVVLGTAVQAGVLSGNPNFKDILLLDVISVSLGIETLGGVMTKLIERNTTIPAYRTEVFSTAADNQTSVDVHLLEGEREFARDNRTLGRLQLVDIAPAPRGVPKIEVTFDIDCGGILGVSAKNLATGAQQSMQGEYAFDD